MFESYDEDDDDFYDPEDDLTSDSDLVDMEDIYDIQEAGYDGDGI